MKAIAALERLGLSPDDRPLPSSPLRFPDGGSFRLEIPSVEDPHVLEAVIEAAAENDVVVNRVSQGSGAMLLKASELTRMVELAGGAGMELALFVGPRAGFDVGAFTRSPSGAGQYGVVRGLRQLTYAVEDVFRAVEVGVRSFLVGDVGLLSVLCELRTAGELPQDCVWKISAYMGPSNPATLQLLERIGAGTINVPTDLTLHELAELRAHVSVPLDIYLEAPDSMGGIVRGHEIGDFVDVGAPVYLKFGLRNARGAYPGGEHLREEGIRMARERVHRAAVALEWLARTRPETRQSAPAAAAVL